MAEPLPALGLALRSENMLCEVCHNQKHSCFQSVLTDVDAVNG